MSKPNTTVLLMNARQQIVRLAAEVERMKGFTLQQSLDMALITLNVEFGFGPERCARFEKAFRETFLAYAEMCIEDGKDDDEIVYTQEKVDRALRVACGPDIMPFQERYADSNLYFRTKEFKEEKP